MEDGGEGEERKTKLEQEVAGVKRKAPVAGPWRASEWSGVVGQVEVPPSCSPLFRQRERRMPTFYFVRESNCQPGISRGGKIKYKGCLLRRIYADPSMDQLLPLWPQDRLDHLSSSLHPDLFSLFHWLFHPPYSVRVWLLSSSSLPLPLLFYSEHSPGSFSLADASGRRGAFCSQLP